MQPIVDPAWLTEHLDEVVICHVGTTMGGEDPVARYHEQRLPGARYLSLDDDLAAPAAARLGRHPLPSPEHFAAALQRAGIAPDDVVVAEDGRGGGFAARLAWMLRTIGQRAALLVGEWPGPFESGPVESGPVDTQDAHRDPVDWPASAIARSDQVVEHINAGGTVIDSRDPARFRGEVEPIDAVAGHVPGAINIPFTSTDPARFDRLDPDTPAIVYCGSGVTACFNALAVEAAGLATPTVYVGSWSGWSTEPDRPVATGPESV